MGVIMYNGIQYTGAGGGGSDVTPNPEGSATDILKKLEIEDTIYGISNTIELTQAEYDDLPSSKLTDNILYIIKDAAGASGGNNKTLSGTVAPTAALGDNGDEYIQYHLSSNTPVIDAKYTKIRGDWVQYQDDSTIVVPVAPAYSAGDHISISQSNEISATYGAFQGTDGTDPGSSGLVPAPAAADEDKYLKSDGTWATVAGGGGDVEDVYVNGASVLDSNKIAQVKSYMELTESQYNALPASKLSDDILYCISDIDYEDRNYFNPIIYSTTEREVGVWIDNKPLYQKTYLFNSLTNVPSGKWFDTGFTMTDISIVGEAYGFYQDATAGVTVPILASCDSGTNQPLYIYLARSASTEMHGFTIQYTKTTDVAGSGSYNTLGVPTVHYDGNEQVIGTWFGKPLYQKIVTITPTTTDTNWHNINHNIADIEDFVKVEGLAIKSTTKSSYPVPGYRPSNNVGFCLNATLTTIDYINNWLSTDILRVILQYTKTTD